MLNDMPRLRIEIEGLRQSVTHCFNHNNQELSDRVIQQINNHITADWVQNEIDNAVKDCIRNAIQNISTNHCLQDTLTKLICESIEEKIK